MRPKTLNCTKHFWAAAFDFAKFFMLPFLHGPHLFFIVYISLLCNLTCAFLFRVKMTWSIHYLIVPWLYLNYTMIWLKLNCLCCDSSLEYALLFYLSISIMKFSSVVVFCYITHWSLILFFGKSCLRLWLVHLSSSFQLILPCGLSDICGYSWFFYYAKLIAQFLPRLG